MKKQLFWKIILRTIFFGFVLFYLYVSLKYRQNTWQFIIVARFWIPLFFTGAIILSHFLYSTPRNVFSLLWGGALMLPGGFYFLFLSWYAVGWYLFSVYILIFTFLVLSDMGGRRLCSKSLGKKFASSPFLKTLPIKTFTYYFFVFLIYFGVIASLSVIF